MEAKSRERTTVAVVGEGSEKAPRSSSPSPEKAARPAAATRDPSALIASVMAVGLSVTALIVALHHRTEHEPAEGGDRKAAVSALGARLDALDERVSDQQMSILLSQIKGRVDLASDSVQALDQSGFHVTGLSVKEELTGVRVEGRLLNTQSVTHTKISMKLTIAGQEASFFVSRVSPGRSTKFSVYVPDVAPKDARYGTFDYENSYVRYRR